MEFKMFSDEYFMREALKEANAALEKGEIPVGAVVVSNDHVIARAHNNTETLNDFTAHAEMQAYTAASNYIGSKFLNDCTLYVTLEPCSMCAGASMWTRVGKIVFGAWDDKKGYHLYGDNLLHPKTEIITGILHEECAELIQKFFKKKR